ncbi:MAG: hypothetical protein GC178_06905 [Flavobacteriales bacterium]|nr:hypothetical protein [Flavobacteriales bacterium]
MNRPFVIAIVLLMCSCSKDPVEQYYENERFYYDLPLFINKQIDNLKKKGQWVRKHVTKDGHSHIIERGDIDWNEELDAFLESDINRPAWRGEFKTDTIILERAYVITYKTENDQIPVKNVVVTIDKDSKQCLSVTVDRRTKNFLYSSDQSLYYTTGEGYMMKGKLSVNYLFDSEYSIESEFIEES